MSTLKKLNDYKRALEVWKKRREKHPGELEPTPEQFSICEADIWAAKNIRKQVIG
jgi:hypothetical protein